SMLIRSSGGAVAPAPTLACITTVPTLPYSRSMCATTASQAGCRPICLHASLPRLGEARGSGRLLRCVSLPTHSPRGDAPLPAAPHLLPRAHAGAPRGPPWVRAGPTRSGPDHPVAVQAQPAHDVGLAQEAHEAALLADGDVVGARLAELLQG